MSSRNAAGHVLVVEDHPPTAKLVSTAFDEVDSSISTQIVRDGSECLDVLRGADDSIADPDLVLLDLALLYVDGFTVLKTRTEDAALRHTPVIVLSDSDDPETVLRCYEYGANTFIPKPDDFDGFLSIAEDVVDYWSSTAELPETFESGA